MNSRRQFLVASTAVLASAVLPKALLAATAEDQVFTNASLEAYLQGSMTAAAFEKVVGSTFTAFLSNGEVSYLRLQTVTTIDPAIAAAQSAARTTMVKTTAKAAVPAVSPVKLTTFHLHFEITGPELPQDTYLIDHGTMGRFAMFIVPGSPQVCGSSFCMLA